MFDRVDQALAWAREALAGVSDSDPLDAARLLAHLLGVSRAALITHPDLPLTAEQAAAYRHAVEQLAAGMPLAYLTGRRAFYDREFIVTPAVLVPRPETELLIEAALEWAKNRRVLRIVDVGTGSGAIIVTLAAHLPQARLWAVDVSAEALAVARQNAALHGVLDRITFVQGDLLEPLIAHNQQVDLIAANLPYIASEELPTLPVARHEPLAALDGGAGGLALIGRLLDQAPRVLANDGLALLEIGAGQGEQVRALARAAFPGAKVTLRYDYAGLDRLVGILRGANHA